MSASTFVAPAIVLAVFVIVGLVMEVRRKHPPGDFAVFALIGVPGLYLGYLSDPLHLPILLIPAAMLCTASFGYQVYLFKRDMRRREQARQEDLE